MIRLFNRLFRRSTEDVLFIKLMDNLDNDKVVNDILKYL